jgi:uncharacterized protein YggE
MSIVPASAQDAFEDRRTVTVQGEGTVTATPDQAVVRFGIVSEAETAEGARSQNATASRNAMNAVRDLGIAEANIQMQGLRLQPRREYDRETRNYEERGFEATRQVVVEVDSLEQLPALVTRVVQQGANRLDGIQYELSDREAVRNDALRAAAEHARAKAALLAETLGAELGEVLQINEQSFDFPRPVFRAEMAMAKASADQAAPEPDAYAAGEIEVSASVQVVFQLR